MVSVAKVQKNRQVWFDLEIYTFFSAKMNVVDDTIPLGSFYVMEKDLRHVSVSDICDYIIENSEKFMNSQNITDIEKRYIFRGVNACHICYKYADGGTVPVNTYMFIKNIRFA